MKQLTLSLFCLLTMLFLLSCDTNKKLDQASAEKAIKQFVSSNSFKGDGGFGQGGSFNIEAISSIEPVSQFSETEASSIVHFNYHDSWANSNLVLKFKFQKNVDKKWILTSLEAVQGIGSQQMAYWVSKNQNINIVAQ